MNNSSQEHGFLQTYQYPAPSRKALLVLFAAVFLLELAGGVYLGYFRKFILQDAFSRTANAFYVFFIEPPRFASIGLVWNPLPSVLQLPLVIWAEIWKPLATHGIAAAIVNSLFAAGTVMILFRTFVRVKVANIYTAVFLFLYASNPFIYYYGFNGMSEGIFFFFTVYTVLCMTLWMKEGTPDYIMRIAFALALAFFCRYEAVPFAAAVGIGALIIIFFSPHEKAFVPATDQKERYFYAEGTAIVLYTPFVFSIFLWILFNWVISGEPFYFLNSPYSNSAYLSLSDAVVKTPWEALAYVAGKTAPFIPVFIGIVVVRIINGKLFRHDFFVLLAIVVAMLAFHYVMLLKGSSYGWLRFFCYILPITFAWLPYELSQPAKTRLIQTITNSVLIIAMLTSWGLTKSALSEDPENTPMKGTEARNITNYINEHLPEEKLLADSFVTGEIILNLEHISNMITSASLDFYDAVDNPRRYGITYILVPDPEEGTGSLDALNTRYPGLYAGKEDWCSEEKAFDGFKLFKVIY